MDTYDEIYLRMKSAYEEESGDGFQEASDIAIRLKLLAGELYKTQTNLEWLKRQMFCTSASGEYLDYLASQRGLSRKQAVKAKGELTFYISEACDHDIVIPTGCVVATADSLPVRFVTTEDEEISAGNVLVSVYAEAEEAGESGNCAAGKAVVPVSVPTEIETVTNRESFSGGLDAETDDELRERVRASFVNTSNGTNAAYYEQLALGVEGIAKAKAVGKVRGAGTVNVYVAAADGDADSSAVVSAQKIISEQREMNVDAVVSNAQSTECDLDVIVYAKNGYETSDVKTLVTEAFNEYVNSLQIGGSFYLSELGAKLLETDCISNYTWNTDMTDKTASSSQRFSPGSATIEVK